MAGGEGDPSCSTLPVEGASSPPRRTFAQALLLSKQRPKISIPLKEPGFTDLGEPAIYFSKADVQATIQFLSFALVAKCSYGRPAFADIKSSIMQCLKISADFIISKLSPRHILLRFDNEADFMKVLIQKNLYIRGFLFRFFRWTPDFNFEADPPSVPVWIGFPGLPANLYHEDCIRSIAGNFGAVLRLHDKTLSLADTSEALVCIEVDLLAPRRERIWIDLDGVGFWQKVNFNRAPVLCSFCHKLGHAADVCKKKLGRRVNDAVRQDFQLPKPKQEYRPRQDGFQPVRHNVPLMNRFEQLQDEAVVQQDCGHCSIGEHLVAEEMLTVAVQETAAHCGGEDYNGVGPSALVATDKDCAGLALCQGESLETEVQSGDRVLLADTGDPISREPYDLARAGKRVSAIAAHDNVLMPLVGQPGHEGLVGKQVEVGVLTRSRARSMEDLPVFLS